MLILRYVDDLPALCLDSSSEARRGPRTPELELLKVVSHLVGAGNRIRVLWKKNQDS